MWIEFEWKVIFSADFIMNTIAWKSKQKDVRMKLKILFHGFSNASVWYLSGLNLERVTL